MSIKDRIKSDPVSYFMHYKKGILYYRIGDYIFRVPVEDTGEGMFAREMRSITMMRWIRLELEAKERYE